MLGFSTNVVANNKCRKAAYRRMLVCDCKRPIFARLGVSNVNGFETEEVAAIGERWPDFDRNDDSVPLAVGNSLNNLVGYPHHKESELPKYISVSQDELEKFANKWFALRKQLKG